MAKRKPIGEMLIEKGVIDENQLRIALSQQGRRGKRLGETLVDMGFLSEKNLAKILSEIFKVPAVDIDTAPISKEAVNLVNEDFCKRHRLIPISLKRIDGKEQIVAAISDPTNLEALDELRFLSKHPVFPVIGTVSGIERAIQSYFEGRPGSKGRATEAPLSPIRENSMEIIHEGDVDRVFMKDVGGSADAERFEKAFKVLVKGLMHKKVLTEEEATRLVAMLEQRK